MDFPGALLHKPVLSSGSAEAVSNISLAASTGVTSAAWPVANLGIFVPFTLRSPYLVRRLWWVNGASVAGTTDMGVYTQGGARLVSAGPQTQAGTSQVQTFTPTAVLLDPGSYYMALSASSTSATYLRWVALTARLLQMWGVAQQGSVATLPDPFTLAAIGSTYLPLFGIANATVI